MHKTHHRARRVLYIIVQLISCFTEVSGLPCLKKKIRQWFPPEETQTTAVLEIALMLLWARYEFVLFNLVLVQQEMHTTLHG